MGVAASAPGAWRRQQPRQVTGQLLQRFQVVYRKHGMGMTMQHGRPLGQWGIPVKAQQRVEPQQPRAVAAQPGQFAVQLGDIAGVQAVADDEHQGAPAHQA